MPMKKVAMKLILWIAKWVPCHAAYRHRMTTYETDGFLQHCIYIYMYALDYDVMFVSIQKDHLEGGIRYFGGKIDMQGPNDLNEHGWPLASKLL